MKQFKYISVVLSVTGFAVVCLLLASDLAGQTQQQQQGCICGVQDVASRVTVRIVPWEPANTAYNFAAEKTFVCDLTTLIQGETSSTVGELKAGKVVRSMHLTGLTSGTPFDIKSLSQLVGRRTTLTWVADSGTLRAKTIGLPYLFAGESLAATVSQTGAAVQGGDDCSCRASSK